MAGAAALISEVGPNLSPEELQSCLESNVIDMGATGKDNIYGWGRMNMIFPILNNYPDPDLDNDNMPDNWEIANGLDPDIDDASGDPDNDGYANLDEFQAGTDPNDADIDDDGISDGGEDINHSGSVDSGESDPNNHLSPNTGSNPNESSRGGDGGGGGGCFISTTAIDSLI